MTEISSYDYVIYEVSEDYRAKDGITGKVAYHSYDVETLIQNRIDELNTDGGGHIYIKNANYEDASITVKSGVFVDIGPNVTGLTYTLNSGGVVNDMSTRTIEGLSSLNTEQVFLGQLTSTPSDSDIGSGNTAFYGKNDGNLYKKPYGGSESQVGGGAVESDKILNFTTSMMEWGAGQTDVEIGRYNLQAGETLQVSRMEMTVKGGTSISSVDVDVYDVDDSSEIDSVSANAVSTTGGQSTSGATVIIRITNTSGSSQTAMIDIRGKIEV